LVENGNLNSVAGGLSDWVGGFAVEAVNLRRERMQQGLDYVGRLVQAANVISDQKWKTEALKASTLSHLVNLGGAYATLNPFTSTNDGLFLQTAWSNFATQTIATQISQFLADSVSKNAATFDYHTRVLRALNLVPDLETPLQDASRIARAIKAGEAFQTVHTMYNQAQASIFSDVLMANNNPAITSIAQKLGVQIALRAGDMNQAGSSNNGLLVGLQSLPMTWTLPTSDMGPQRQLIPSSMESQLSIQFYQPAPKLHPPQQEQRLLGNSIQTVNNYTTWMYIAEYEDDLKSKFKGDTRNMVTRFRRVHYSGFAWDNVII
jgi:hypothetical protein